MDEDTRTNSGSPAHSQEDFEPTDHTVTRWQGGDEQAFATLYHRFAPLLALRVQRNRSWPSLSRRLQVDDVAQDVWSRVLRLVKKNFQPSGPGSFIAYLEQVCDGTVIDLVREGTALKRGQGQAPESIDNAHLPETRSMPGLPAAETPTSHARRSEIVEIATRELGEDEFIAWDLLEYRGYTSAEAGLAMGCSDSHARKLLMRARQTLIPWFLDGDLAN